MLLFSVVLAVLGCRAAWSGKASGYSQGSVPLPQYGGEMVVIPKLKKHVECVFIDTLEKFKKIPKKLIEEYNENEAPEDITHILPPIENGKRQLSLCIMNNTIVGVAETADQVRAGIDADGHYAGTCTGVRRHKEDKELQEACLEEGKAWWGGKSTKIRESRGIAFISIRRKYLGKGLCTPFFTFILENLKQYKGEGGHLTMFNRAKWEGTAACHCFYKAGIKAGYRVEFQGFKHPSAVWHDSPAGTAFRETKARMGKPFPRYKDQRGPKRKMTLSDCKLDENDILAYQEIHFYYPGQ